MFVGTPDGRTLVSSGVIDDGQAIRIVDPESRVAVADGDIGKIWVNVRALPLATGTSPRRRRKCLARRLGLRRRSLPAHRRSRMHRRWQAVRHRADRGRPHSPRREVLSPGHPEGEVPSKRIFRSSPAAEWLAQSTATRMHRAGRRDRAPPDRRIQRRTPAGHCFDQTSRRRRHQVSPVRHVGDRAGGKPSGTSGKLQRFLCRAAAFVRVSSSCSRSGVNHP